jgi:hypothetical protein
VLWRGIGRGVSWVVRIYVVILYKAKGWECGSGGGKGWNKDVGDKKGGQGQCVGGVEIWGGGTERREIEKREKVNGKGKEARQGNLVGVGDY